MLQFTNIKTKSIILSLCCAPLLLSSIASAETAAGSTEPQGMVIWDNAPDSSRGKAPNNAGVKVLGDSQQERVVLEGSLNYGDELKPAPESKKSDRSQKMVQEPAEEGQTEEQLEKYLEPTEPPTKISKIIDIYLENKSKPQSFLTSFTTKRADVDLKLQQHQPSDVPAESRFQIANFGNYIRLGHEASDQLIGYSKNYFGFTSVYLEKAYYEPRDFWTRFIIAPSNEEDWYLIRSYTNPKKCLAIGMRQQLRLKTCNIKDKWQQWRFLREKADAYWVPNMELMDLDIM